MNALDGMAIDSPRQFLLFPELAVELRLKIWEYCLPGPRVVKVWYPKPAANQKSPPGLITSAPVPAILHVNRESRAEVLRTHPLLFGFHGRPGVVPFDPRNDVLFFVPSPVPPGVYMPDLFADIKISLILISDVELALVQRLAIDAAPTLLPNGRLPPSVQEIQDPYQLCQTRRTLEVLEDIRRYLPGLRELHLVTPQQTGPSLQPSPLHDALCLKPSLEEWTKRAIAILAEETEGWRTPVCSVQSADHLLSPSTDPVPNLGAFHMAFPSNCPAFDLVRNSLRDLLRQIRPSRLQYASSAYD